MGGRMAKNARSAEVLHQHDVRVATLELVVEQPSAVGRDVGPPPELSINAGDALFLTSNQVIKVDGRWLRARVKEIDALFRWSFGQGPHEQAGRLGKFEDPVPFAG